MTGKTIRIFLADGEPTGILLAEILIAGAGLEHWASLMTWSLRERNVGG